MEDQSKDPNMLLIAMVRTQDVVVVDADAEDVEDVEESDMTLDQEMPKKVPHAEVVVVEAVVEEAVAELDTTAEAKKHLVIKMEENAEDVEDVVVDVDAEDVVVEVVEDKEDTATLRYLTCNS